MSSITDLSVKIFIALSDTGQTKAKWIPREGFMWARDNAAGLAPLPVGVSNYIGVGGHRYVSGNTSQHRIF